MTGKLGVGILVFNDVEVLDFAGPFEVFSRARLIPGLDSRRSEDSAPFRVFTVAPRAGRVVAVGGLEIVPQFDFQTAPAIDLLVVPGGFGTRPLLENEEVLDWLRRTAATAQRVTSVCTGALLLARVGLLAGRSATTHWSALDRLAAMDATIAVQRDQRVVEDTIVTSAGVSAGIDMALVLVGQIAGPEVAQAIQLGIEYDPQPPFDAGSPAKAPHAVAALAQAMEDSEG
jgi:cyclohexyl-isocyanide hydratase